MTTMISPSLTPKSLDAYGITTASSSKALCHKTYSQFKLSSNSILLNTFLDGGLPVGAITEWSAPLGHGGRSVILSFLYRRRPEFTTRVAGALVGDQSIRSVNENNPPEDPPYPNPALANSISFGKTSVTTAAPTPTLWAYPDGQLAVYPPAWAARGISLTHIRFARCLKPLTQLKAVFMDALFKIIVLDTPVHLSDDDLAFIARQARAHRQTIILLRNHVLTPHNGSVWTRLRLNCSRDPASCRIRLDVIRGLSPRHLSLDWTEH